MAKTIVVAAVGGPEVMKIADIDVGHPGPGEIRLRQTAMGVNFGDIHKRRGTAPAHAMAEISMAATKCTIVGVAKARISLEPPTPLICATSVSTTNCSPVRAPADEPTIT